MNTQLPDTIPTIEAPSWLAEFASEGYRFAPAAEMRALLARHGSLDDWAMFAQSWNDLEVDEYMADHGRYRRRRHAVFESDATGNPRRMAHRPHYQALQYNALHGGIERWFAPVLPAIGESRSLRTILSFCSGLFSRLAGDSPSWLVEAHQFRIEARAGEAGLPTPEGMHRDGVDYVLVLLVRRCNINSGTTLIGGDASGFSSSFTLVEPFDAALVDDHRVYHGVTPVEPLDESSAAYRDVLVLTFRRR